MVAGTLPGPAGSWTSDAIAVTAGANDDISATVASGATAATPRVVVSALTAGGSAATPLLSLSQLVPVGAVSTLVGQVTIPAGVSAVVIELCDDVDANATVGFDKIGLFARD